MRACATVSSVLCATARIERTDVPSLLRIYRKVEVWRGSSTAHDLGIRDRVLYAQKFMPIHTFRSYGVPHERSTLPRRTMGDSALRIRKHGWMSQGR